MDCQSPESTGKIKDLICKEMSLSYFNPSKETSLQVNASNKGRGAVLLQEGRPIAFVSKVLTETKQRYVNIERELPAVLFDCERFRTYLYGCKFQVESDHKPLEMISQKNLIAVPPRLQRILLRLQEYDLSIIYRPGKEIPGRRILPVTKQKTQRDKPQCKCGFCSVFHRKVDTNTSGNKS